MRSRKKKSGKKSFTRFDVLKLHLAEECQQEVKNLMNLLRPKWRDDLCNAVIDYVHTGKRKDYKKSRVMAKLFDKATQIIIIINK